MSVVGPRPPVTYHPYAGYEAYSENAKKRFVMRPGITGLAQVRKRNSATWVCGRVRAGCRGCRRPACAGRRWCV